MKKLKATEDIKLAHAGLNVKKDDILSLDNDVCSLNGKVIEKGEIDFKVLVKWAEKGKFVEEVKASSSKKKQTQAAEETVVEAPADTPTDTEA